MKLVYGIWYMVYRKSNIRYTKSRLGITINQKGLTLLEVLVAMGIATIAGTLLMVIMINSAGLFSQQSSKVQQGLSINDALSTIRESIKQASSVADQYTNGSTTYTTGTNQLVLKVFSVDSSGNIVENTFDYFVFFLDQNSLRFKVFPDSLLSSRGMADQIFSTMVENLNFQYLNSAIPPIEVIPQNAAKVRISLTLKQKNGLNFETSTATSEANLRND